MKDIYTGTIYADKDVLKNAPRSKKEQKLEFFKVGYFISDDVLEQEYKKRGLLPADPYTLAAWCEKNQEKDTFYATHWKDNGWCFAAFGSWRGGRRVRVRRGGGWDDRWSFAGVPEVASVLETSEKHLDTLPLTLVVNGTTYRRV